MNKKEELKMDPMVLEKLTNKTNRSKGQTQFLYNLVDGDFCRLIELEEKLTNNYIGWCPGDKESVEEVLDMENKGKFKLELKDFITV